MGVERRLIAQQALQQDVDVRGRKNVLAPRHQGHALQMIVDRDREVIAGRRVLAGNDEGFRAVLIPSLAGNVANVLERFSKIVPISLEERQNSRGAHFS